jgi:hypothetical protein
VERRERDRERESERAKRTPSILLLCVHVNPENGPLANFFPFASFYISFNHENIVVPIRVRRNKSILKTLQAISRVHLDFVLVAQDIVLIRERKEK